MCQLVSHLWLDRDVLLMGFNRDLAMYAAVTPMPMLSLRSAPEALNALAASSIVMDWLGDAERTYTTAMGGGGGGGGGGKAP